MTKVNKTIKLVIVFAIILIGMCISNNNVVSAITYNDNDNKVFFTIEDLGFGGTNKVETVWLKNSNSGEDFDWISNVLTIKNVKQSTLNNYANTTHEVQANIKMQIPDNILKAELDDVECKIENINGKKYIEINDTLHYTNTPFSKPVKEDVENIIIGEKNLDNENVKFTYIKLYSSETEYKKYQVNNSICVCSENVPFNYSSSVVNKYGQEYPTLGGMGGYIFWDKTYLQADYHTEQEYRQFIEMPENINFKDTYFQVNIDVFQGDTIEVENLGTLYYAGRSNIKTYAIDENGEDIIKYIPSYSYKNTLDNLKEPKEGSLPTIVAKTESGYTLKRTIKKIYNISTEYKEETVTGTIDIKNQEITNNILFSVSGTGNAKLDTIEIPKDDKLYQKLENGLEDIIDTEVYNSINMVVYDIQVIEGSYQGKLNLTFDVGTENNGKEYIVGHLVNGLEYEYFKGTVENGKITITVDSLSPFMISLLEEKQNSDTNNTETADSNNNSNSNKLDETPKTGNTNYIVYISILAVMSLAVIIIIKQNKE